MLLGTARDPSEVLGKMPPNYNVLNVEKAAVAAVMAGCEPRQFHVALAALECALDPALCLHGIHATTMGITPCVIVSGPARHDAGLNFRHGAMGSSGIQNRANAAIGRTLKLCLQNVGGARLAGTESSTLGSPSKFTLCVAEWEERAPAWEPLHTLPEHGGCAAGQSAVTVMSACAGPTQISDFTTKDAEQILGKFATSMRTAMIEGYGHISDLLLVVCPEHYDSLLAGGYDSKMKVQQRLFDLTDGNCSVEGAGPKFESPQSIHIIVAGAPGGKFSAWMHGFGFGARAAGEATMSRAVSTPVAPWAGVRSPIAPAGIATDAGQEERLLVDAGPYEAIPELALVPRKADLAVAPVAFLDINKPKGNIFLDSVASSLTAQYPGIVINRYNKPGPSRPCSVELREKVLADGNGTLIAALAD
jgi:hypothetical protein